MRKQFAVTLALVALATTLLTGLSAITAQVRDKTEAALRVAMDKETVEGDLKGAIEQYKKIAESKDRALAAKALLRMAECYQKLGDTEWRRIYQRVANQFQDQKEAAALARMRLTGSGASTGMNSKLVWSGPKVDSMGTVSPDGRVVSFPDWETGDLAIHEFATGMDRHITNNKVVNRGYSEFAEESAISRDGKQIAYKWFNNGLNKERYELRLANLTGNPNPRPLYDNPDVTWLMPTDWAPDGKAIAVQFQRKDRTRQFGLVSVTDGSLRVLKSVDWRPEGANRMVFSPDGQWLGYDLPPNSASTERDIFVLSVDGSREVHAVEHRGQNVMAGWSPDGKWLLFFSDRNGTTDLWAVQFSNGKVDEHPQLLKTGFDRSIALGVTSSGVLYYAQTKGGSSSRIQIESFDRATGKLSLPVELSQSYRDSDATPIWSFDAKRLAYVSQRGPQRDFVVIRSIESGQVIQELQPSLNSIGLHAWSPEGRTLIVSGQDFKGRWGTYLVDSETGDVKELNLNQGDNRSQAVRPVYSPCWSPDGRSFLIETRGLKGGLYRVDTRTGDSSEVMPSAPGQTGSYAKWSPDGKSIFYRRLFEKNGVAIIVRDVSSGEEKELLRRPFFLGPPKPTRDGQYVVTDSVDPASNSRVILLIPVAGGEPRVLMQAPSNVETGLLNSVNRGQWMVPEPGHDGCGPGAGAEDPLLILKRLGDSAGGGVAKLKEPSELWLVPLSGGEPKKIGDTPAGFAVGDMTTSPDGRHLAYAVTDAGAPRPVTEIWALENFLPKAIAAR